MKITRKIVIVAAVLAAILAVSVGLAACGSANAGDTTTTAAPTTTTAAPTPTTAGNTPTTAGETTTTAATTVTTVGAQQLKHVVFGITGVACEAAIYVAKENGIFKKYGLDVELKQEGFEEAKTNLATGHVDATDGNLGYIKPIEQGLDLQVVGGIHKGCITGVSPAGSTIKSPADLKGKRLGVNAIGDIPYILALAAIKDAGLTEEDVTFKVYPIADLPLALKKGEIDAFVNWDPFAAQYISENGGQYWFESNVNPPFDKNWCCSLFLPRSYASENPETVKALWSAISEATIWVSQNIDATAQLEVDKKYVAGDPKAIAERLRSYGWAPSTTDAKAGLLDELQRLKTLEVLDAGTDPQALLDKIWYALPQS